MIYTDTGQPHPSNASILLSLFCRAALISFVQSAGVVLVSRLSLWSIGTGALIAFIWIGNTRVSVDHRIRFSRAAYALGGGAGAGLTLMVAWWTG